jgi:hypothetical protein
MSFLIHSCSLCLIFLCWYSRDCSKYSRSQNSPWTIWDGQQVTPE